MRLNNWHGAIIKGLCSGERRSASIDSLSDRALRALNILSRKNRRQFLLKQIARAIKQLCNQGVLFETAPGRVKLLHEVDSDRVQRLLAKPTHPWTDEVAAPAESSDDQVELDEADDDDEDDSVEEDAEEIPIPRLPALKAATFGSSKPEIRVAPEDSDGLDSDQRAALDVLSPSDIPVSDATRFVEMAHGNRSEGPVPAGLPAQLSALQEHLASVADVRWHVAGRVAKGRIDTHDVQVELRRDGGLRVRLAFPSERLSAVLHRHVKAGPKPGQPPEQNQATVAA